MIIKVNFKEAENHLGRLIEEAIAGQEVVIASAGGRMVRLVPVPQEEARKSNESKPTNTVGHALDRFMGTWTAEQEAEVLEAVEFLDRMDESQYDRVSRFLEELEQEHGPIDPQIVEEVREAFPIPRKSSRG
jgi:antitoxin (DNA-binding transcriptional repressor) of toxin-antitoxin stability system